MLIDKRPDLPENFSDFIAEFTEICFLPSQLQKVDVVFAFGTLAEYKLMADHLVNLYTSGICDKFILTGRAPEHIVHVNEGETEAELSYYSLPEKMRREANIILETKSTNSTQNIENSLPYLEPYKNGKIGCVARSWAGRQMYHFKRFMPETESLFMPFDGMRADGMPFTAKDWYQNEDACKRVWGEIQRVKKYGEAGFMVYRDDLRQKIDNLFSKIKP